MIFIEWFIYLKVLKEQFLCFPNLNKTNLDYNVGVYFACVT